MIRNPKGMAQRAEAAGVTVIKQHDGNSATGKACARILSEVDHRNWSKDQDGGPGFGEIDHYKLLQPVMRTELTMPLVFEEHLRAAVPRTAPLTAWTLWPAAHVSISMGCSGD